MTFNTLKKMLPARKEPEASSFFVVPHSANLAYVWCELQDDAALEELRVSGAAVPVLDRKRLFRPGQNLEVFLVAASNLRDGASCELHLTSKSGQEWSVDVEARLARWDNPDTRRVLRFIAKRFQTEVEAPEILERYLAFASEWQAPGRIIEHFPEGQIAAIGVECGEGEFDAYAVTPDGLKSILVRPLCTAAEGNLVWIQGEAPRDLYLDLAGELVRITPKVGQNTPEPVLSLSVPTKQAIIDALHDVIEDASPELGAWVAKLCEPRTAIRADTTTLEVVGTARLPSRDLIVCLGVRGDLLDLGTFSLRSFGATDDAEIEVFACDTSAASEAGWQTQIILKISGSLGEAHCHRLDWLHHGQHHSAWIRETDGKNASTYQLARDFMTVASVHPEAFASVIHPLATLGGGVSAPRLTQRIDFRSPDRQADADVFVFVDADLEALHRTLLALSLTSGDTALDIHLCVFKRSLVAELKAKIATWLECYGVSLEVLCYGPRTAEADVVRALLGGDTPRIFCRAGTVPRQSDWLAVVLNQLTDGRDDICIAPSVEIDARHSDTPRMQAIAPANGNGLGHASVAPLIGAVAVAAGVENPTAKSGRLFTMEAVLLELASVTNRTVGNGIHALRRATFAQTGSGEGPDAFQERLDIYSLQEALGPSPTADIRTMIA